MNNLQTIHQAALREGAEVKYRYENGSLQMIGHNFPLSIRENEFEFLKNFIIENNLKIGYEVATAFGASSTAIGMGFKETGGKLATMDAYIEEALNSCTYNGAPEQTHENMDGWKSVNFLRQHFGLEDVVFPHVGWSPTNTEEVIRGIHGDEKLDFIFIDALHYDEPFMADVKSVLPFLADKYAIFFHDVHCFSDAAKQFIVDTFGEMYVTPPECRLEHKGGYNLSYINKLS